MPRLRRPAPVRLALAVDDRRRRLAEDRRGGRRLPPAQHHDVSAIRGHTSVLEQADATCGRAGHEAGGVFQRELGHILRVEAIHVLARVDGAHDGAFVDVLRRRALDQDAVDGGIGIELGHQRQEFLLRGVFGQFVLHGVQAQVLAFLVLAAHVGAGCGVIAHQHHRQPGLLPLFGEFGDITLAFLQHGGGDFGSLNQLHAVR